jgi:release factor glutamine methyltransferase
MRLTAFPRPGWGMRTIKAGGPTIGESLAGSISCLEETSETPGLDAQVLLAHIMERPRSWILAHPEVHLSRDQGITVESQISRLAMGEPLPYILGSWEFYGMEFVVSPDVLIPRPETELLVDRAIYWLKELERRNVELRVIDVGTGSGCIATSLAVYVPGIILSATDISPAALKVAHMNADRLNVSGKITFLECDLFPHDSIHHRFSLIAANPPYVPTKELPKPLENGGEPRLALDGGFDGLDLIRRILNDAPPRLLPGGVMLMEIEASKGPTVVELATKVFPMAKIYLHKDLAGRDRLLEVQV